MSQKLILRLKGDFYKYTSNLEPTVWNLPDFEAFLFLNYQISYKWSLVGNLFYFGARQDSATNDSLLSETSNETLGSFFDANLQLDYQVSSQWGAFLKVNNMTNANYSRWNHYPVQGFQVLGGASYKFDF
jgi:outer membrane cobalamin receptor